MSEQSLLYAIPMQVQSLNDCDAFVAGKRCCGGPVTQKVVESGVADAVLTLFGVGKSLYPSVLECKKCKNSMLFSYLLHRLVVTDMGKWGFGSKTGSAGCKCPELSST